MLVGMIMVEERKYVPSATSTVSAVEAAATAACMFVAAVAHEVNGAVFEPSGET